MTPDDRSNRTVLTPEVIRRALERLATILDETGVDAEITVYGGASLALAYFETDRTATADVDGTYLPTSEVEAAAKQVADEMNLADAWLNNKMRMFLPPADSEASVTFLERGNVTIRVGSARAVLALKLRASRPGRDFEDIAVLVRACGFTSVSECEALVEDYFLGEEEIPPRGYLLLDRAFEEVRVTNADPPFVLPAVTSSGRPPAARP